MQGSPGREGRRSYREKVEQLVEACLRRVRAYELPDDAEPPTAAWPSDE
jgi:hypothetical protein